MRNTKEWDHFFFVNLNQIFCTRSFFKNVQFGENLKKSEQNLLHASGFVGFMMGTDGLLTPRKLNHFNQIIRESRSRSMVMIVPGT